MAETGVGRVVVVESDDETQIIAPLPDPVFVQVSDVGLQGPQGIPGPAGYHFQTVHTWVVGGEIRVAEGEVDFLPPMFIALSAEQTTEVAEVRYRINSGTSVTFKLQKNGIDLTGFTNITATTTPGVTDPANQSLVDGDLVAPVVTAVAGDPLNMTISVVLEHAS